MIENEYREFYTREAQEYEMVRYGSHYGRLFRLLQQASVENALVSEPRPCAILDVATGTGQMLPVLARTGALVVASDLTPAMLAEAKRRLVGEQGVVYCVSDALRLPYPDASFDVVASSRFLHLFEPDTQCLLVAEMVRVLRPGGTLLVDFYSADARRLFRWPIAVYRTLLRKRPENDHRVGVCDGYDMVESCGMQVAHVEGIGNFTLILMMWLPLALQLRVGRWLGRHCAKLSEQFMVVARKS